VRRIGERLTAYIAGVKDARTLGSWARNGDYSLQCRRRFQIALASVRVLEERHEDPDAVAAWFTWLNDLLDDSSPATLLRESTDDNIETRGKQILAAARAQLTE
jgi:hypothetical protein